MEIDRTVVIGDIHGCLNEFQELLDLVDYKSPHVRVILVGDLIDRGYYSQQCIKLARELGLEAVLANHELKFLKWYRSQGSRMDNTYHKLPHYTQFSDEDINYISQMPLYIKLPELNTIVIHAGVRPGVSIENQRKEDLCYLRYVDANQKFVSLKKIKAAGGKPEALGPKFWTEFGPFGMGDIIYGHSVWKEPRIDQFEDGSKCIGIDLGCCFGGTLCGYIIETGEFVQVKAKQVYYKPDYEIT